MADKNITQGTSFLCANGCGFFGSAATNDLCSKCFRDLRMKVALDKFSGLRLASDNSPSERQGDAAAVPTCVTGVEKKMSNRCGCCNKKVGMVGFACRCGVTFCGTHRYPEKHNCNFDYKRQGREAIAKANPVVKGDKIQRF